MDNGLSMDMRNSPLSQILVDPSNTDQVLDA